MHCQIQMMIWTLFHFFNILRLFTPIILNLLNFQSDKSHYQFYINSKFFKKQCLTSKSCMEWDCSLFEFSRFSKSRTIDACFRLNRTLATLRFKHSWNKNQMWTACFIVSLIQCIYFCRRSVWQKLHLFDTVKHVLLNIMNW